jgi:hypothetical protein
MSQSRSASRRPRPAGVNTPQVSCRGCYGFSTGAPTRLPHSVHDPS